MPNNYVLLETINLSQSATSITFDNLPTSGYTDLKIVASVRTTSNFATQQIFMTFNGITTGYTARQAYGDGANPASATLNNSGAAISIVNINTTQSTANTFSNTEIYIPNYRSGVFKPVSAESVSENFASGTGNLIGMASGLWSNTAAITSITFTNQSADNFLANSTFSLYGIASLGTTPTIAPKADGGDIVATDGTYWYHAFLTSGNFKPQRSLICDYLVIAGGGGGGGQIGGGGGAGGLRYFTSQSFAANTLYPAIIGAGGAGINGASSQPNNGTNSSFASTSATGGGGGGGNGGPFASGISGGSGGGAGEAPGSGSGNTGGYTPVEGYAGGGANNSPNYGSGGGGGAGGVGSTGTTSAGGNGGTGVNTYSAWATATNTGVSGFYAGGGGGSILQSSGNGSGGAGGGGRGGCFEDIVQPASGTANTGGGGGGQASNNASLRSGSGGSGIVIIRYAVI
jgi:hypothetical protein